MTKEIDKVLNECDLNEGWLLPIQDYCTAFEPKKTKINDIVKLYHFLETNKEVLGIPDIHEVNEKITNYEHNQEILVNLVHKAPSIESLRLIHLNFLKRHNAEVLNSLSWFVHNPLEGKELKQEEKRITKLIKLDLEKLLNIFSERESNFTEYWKKNFPESSLIYSLVPKNEYWVGRINANNSFSELTSIDVKVLGTEKPSDAQIQTCLNIEENYERLIEQALLLSYEGSGNFKMGICNCSFEIKSREKVNTYYLEIDNNYDSDYFICNEGVFKVDEE